MKFTGEYPILCLTSNAQKNLISLSGKVFILLNVKKFKGNLVFNFEKASKKNPHRCKIIQSSFRSESK